MYEKTLNIGTAKVNNAYEWQKVSYNSKNNQTVAKPKQQQQQQPHAAKTIKISAKNATKATSTTTTNATLPLLKSIAVKPQKQNPSQSQNQQIKFVGSAARRQTLAHQIKRAHRHLLTSGGQDKPQKSKQYKFNLFNSDCLLHAHDIFK